MAQIVKPNFLDPDVFKKIETDCYNAGKNGDMIDYSDFPAAEYRYFERLCGVYASYSRGEISLSQAKAKKQVFYKDYRNDLNQTLKYSEVCRKHQETIKATEMLCSELCKAAVKLPDSATEALKIALQIITAARGEDVTEKTVLRGLDSGES